MATLELTTHEIQLPDAPALPGLTFRWFRGPEDYPKMIAVLNASARADQVERAETVENIANTYAHLTHCDPYQDMLFVEMNGEVIGYNRIWWEEEEAGNRLYGFVGFSHPDWRGRGIGRAVLHWLEGRGRALDAAHPFDGQSSEGSLRRFFQSFAADSETAREQLLLNEGYTAVRHGYTMTRSLAEPIELTPLPEGFEVRPAQPDHYRAIWEADQEAFRDHWGYVPGTEDNYQEWLNHPLFNPSLWKVAWHVETNQVAGMVQNFVNPNENKVFNRERGYTEGISVRRPWRKRGLARALIMRSLQMFKDMGMTEAALGVDTQNLSGALRLYESCGFRTIKRQSIYRKPLE